MVCWKAGADPEGILHGVLEDRGGSRGHNMVCWKAGADPRRTNVRQTNVMCGYVK